MTVAHQGNESKIIFPVKIMLWKIRKCRVFQPNMTLVHNQLKLLTIYCSHVPMKWCIFLYVEWFASKIFRTIQSWEDLAECTDFVENCCNLNLKCFAAINIKVISIRCVEGEYTQIYWCTHAWTKQHIKGFFFFFLRGLKHWISRKGFFFGFFFFF